MVAGGLIVQAADTGRVLMIQRTPDKHDDDATYARWEWPGGCLDVDDDSVWQGALREWEEETGSALGEDAEHVGSFLSEDGVYQAYVIQVPSEADLEFDPQPEEVSAVGWWDPADLVDGRVRDKVRENLEPLQRFLLPTPAMKAASTGPPPNLADASPEGLAMVPPHHCANCCLAGHPNCVKYGDWSVRPDQVCDGWQYSERAGIASASQGLITPGVPGATPGPAMKAEAAARLASYHRHTDRIVEHYQAEIAQAFTDLLSPDALRNAIEETRTAVPLTGVAKAAPLVLAVTAVAALRRRLGAVGRLTQIFRSMWGDAALQAAHTASEQVGAVIGGTFSSLTQELPDDYWSNWRPGWGEAADQLADGGMRDMLDQAGIEIKSVIDSRLDALGDAIATGVAAGDSVDSIAGTLTDILSDPSRAGMVANTEVCRAMTTQTMQDYQQSGVEQVQWLAEADACLDCQENEDASPIGIGDDWPNGPPPAHPNCRCALAPLIDASDQEDQGVQ